MEGKSLTCVVERSQDFVKNNGKPWGGSYVSTSLGRVISLSGSEYSCPALG
jgi:hypothetical protein